MKLFHHIAISNRYILRICVVMLIPVASYTQNLCGGATLITSNITTCVNTPGTLVGATYTAFTGACGSSGGNRNDVWFRFVANSATPTITITSGVANMRFQVLSGTCAGLTSVYCSTGPSAAIPNGNALAIGNTYYIRVYSNSNATGAFNICVVDPPLTIRSGNSYVNITKKTNGGVVENGDTLEIRMTIHVTTGTAFYVRYADNIPSNTQMATGTQDSIRVITNEGLTYKRFTLASDGDAATYIASPPAGQYNIRMNLGFGTPNSAATIPGSPADNTLTSFTGAAAMANNSRPRGGGGLLFATAFRVVVSGNAGDTITLGSGQLAYKTTNNSGAADVFLNTIPYKIFISDPATLCEDNTGINIAGEFGGTFGTGSTLNRSTGPTFPIPGYNYLNNVSATQAVGDGNYAIVNNISPRSSQNRTARRVPNCTVVLPIPPLDSCNNRMFNGHWDVDGDHSGTTTSTGNLPPGPSDPGGYMLMVNADYVASEVYRQTIEGLCPNTDYEFSAWVRNICPTCGIDSTGVSQYLPGVLPNLTFVLDDVDRYSTGYLDTLGWQKKGFLFRTGPNQDSMTFSIRNNGQGGGGNDWVMDDITITTCLPTMSYSPSVTPNVCEGNTLTIHDTIRSYFDNYIHYIWQRSTDGGTSWTDVTAPGTGTPVLIGGSYQYVATYTIPPGNSTLADSADLYRVIVATTDDNLSEASCQVTDQTNIITLNVLDCDPVLKTDLLSFNGKLVNNNGHLSWSTSWEESLLHFIIEKSDNGTDFTKAGIVNGYNNNATINQYSFIDPVLLTDKAWYRIVIVTPEGKKKYSSIIQLRKNMPGFDFGNIINPFSSALVFDIIVDRNALVTVNLIDMAGRTVLSGKHKVYTGINNLNLANAQAIQSGVYTLQVINADNVIRKRVVKRY